MKIKRLTIKNFKGTAHEVVDFATTGANIVRPNGQGKSTIMHAYFWLLDGKDADGSTLRIKPEKNGVELHNLETEVEAEFYDGPTLRRTMVESWVRKRGEVEPEFKGNITSLFVDSADAKAADWPKLVAAMFGGPNVPAPWRLFSQPSYFFSEMLTVSQKNSFLLSLAQVPGDAFLAAQVSTELSPYVDQLRDTTTFLKQLKNEAARESKAVADEQGRLSAFTETAARHEAVIKDFDLVATKGALQSVEAKLATLVSTPNAGMQELASKQSVLVAERVKIENQITTELQSARQKYSNELHLHNKTKQAKQHKLSELALESSQLKVEISQLEAQLVELRADFTKHRDAAKDCNCPTCSQPLPEAMLKNKEQETIKSLEAINTVGKTKAALIEAKQTRLQACEAEAKTIEAEIKAMVSPTEPTEHPIREPHGPRLCDIELELSELADQIETLAKANANEARETLRNELELSKTDYTKAIATFEATKAAMESAQADAAAAQAKLSTANENKAAKEYLAILVEQFQKLKNEYISESVNCLFDKVKFVFVKTGYNQGEREICDALVDGITYATTNTGAKFAAGLEFCDVMQKRLEVEAPIFLDNVESYTGEIHSDCQLVALHAAKA